MRKIVCSGERFDSMNASRNPEREPALVVISTLSSASITGRGAGIGTVGPMSNVSWTFLIDAISAYCSSVIAGTSAGSVMRMMSPGFVGERLRRDRTVRVGDSPELFGIAEVERGDDGRVAGRRRRRARARSAYRSGCGTNRRRK